MNRHPYLPSYYWLQKSSQLIQDVFHQQWVPIESLIEDRGCSFFNMSFQFQKPPSVSASECIWISSHTCFLSHHVGENPSPSPPPTPVFSGFFKDLFNSTPQFFNYFLPEKKETHHIMTRPKSQPKPPALVMGQVKTTSPPPKGGAPRFKIWQRAGDLVGRKNSMAKKLLFNRDPYNGLL